MARNVLVVGVSILAIVLVIWRWAYEWMIGLSVFRERVYVLGSGERARTVVETLRTRRDAGMEVVGGDEPRRVGWGSRAFCGGTSRLLRAEDSH